MSTLKDKYKSEVTPALCETFGIKNAMCVPAVKKVVVNMGLGLKDKDAQATLVTQLAAITGQQPQIRNARNSISNFKLREGMTVGAKVTLRGERMYEFLDRLMNSALPRIRDFRGLAGGGFDGRGNFTLGLKEQSIFPEIDPNDVGVEQGMDITVVTSTDSDKEARELLRLLGMPFTEKSSGGRDNG